MYTLRNVRRTHSSFPNDRYTAVANAKYESTINYTPSLILFNNDTNTNVHVYS